MNTKNKVSLCGLYGTLAFPPRPTDNPNKISKDTKYLLEIQTGRIDLTNGTKNEATEKFRELNNRNIHVFELNGDKTLTQLFVRKNMRMIIKGIAMKSTNWKFWRKNHKDDLQLE